MVLGTCIGETVVEIEGRGVAALAVAAIGVDRESGGFGLYGNVLDLELSKISLDIKSCRFKVDVQPFETLTVVSQTAMGDVIRCPASRSLDEKNSASTSSMSMAQNADASRNIGTQSS